MNIVWDTAAYRGADHALHIDGIDMGWVDKRGGDGTKYRVCCMWMTSTPDDRVTSGHLLATSYPEEHVFNTMDEAKQALLETATVMYIGGWRGR